MITAVGMSNLPRSFGFVHDDVPIACRKNVNISHNQGEGYPTDASPEKLTCKLLIQQVPSDSSKVECNANARIDVAKHFSIDSDRIRS